MLISVYLFIFFSLPSLPSPKTKSVDASNKEDLKKVDRPLFEDFWERFLASIDALRENRQRTVFRMTLIKGFYLVIYFYLFVCYLLFLLGCIVFFFGIGFFFCYWYYFVFNHIHFLIQIITLMIWMDMLI